jgi:hypothetical protein
MKKLLNLIPILFVLCSCGSKAALDFSETIVKKEKSLQTDIIKTENKVKTYYENHQYDSMAAVSEKMERIIGDRLDEIKNLKTPDVKLADEFKSESVNYFAYMKKVYTSYVQYAKAETEEIRDKEFKNLQDVVAKKDEVIRKMRDSQKRFAEANGFKIKK